MEKLDLIEKITLAKNSKDVLVLDELAETIDRELAWKYNYSYQGSMGEWDDREYEVREAVASNPHTSSLTLWKMVDDPNADVIYAIVENPNSDSDTLSKVAYRYTEGDDFLSFVLEHKNLTPSLLASLIIDGKRNEYNSYEVHEDEFINHDFITPELLEKWSKSVHPELRTFVAENPQTDYKTLYEIANKDEDYEIAEKAIENENFFNKKQLLKEF